ncbi:MAG: hypothetical protein HOH74_22220 [Gemmatimonadetes bacterium]|jgi:hypothetical protein|nr:hypothetical protein [Gemmatimonadota bacterium]
MNLFVSKLGNDSDGSSWATAFRTVQQALCAVPDDGGGHTITIRPDTYMEANLFAAHPGTAGAPNLLVGDTDGSLGSGTSGSVVIDAGDPKQGFKSYDWWGTLKSYKQGWSEDHTESSFSAIGWDRWILRGLYVTGGDGGLMWDCVDRVEPFTVLVEDCVSMGRAFGGGVASCLSRPDEPITFRRCHLWALDWWGDTAAAYVRVENETMPAQPDVVFEDCTMVSPQCALKVGNYGFTTSSHVRVSGCRLIALNFSQPHGTPTDGLIQSVEQGRYLHVDLEHSTLVGYRVFGVTVAKDTVAQIQYTTRGAVQAYVQFEQEVPKGMHRLGGWPADLLADLMPSQPPRRGPALEPQGLVQEDMCEMSPLLWRDRLCHLECVRPGGSGEPHEYYLLLRDAESGEELARFAEGYGLGCAIVTRSLASGERLHVFASQWGDGTWNHVTRFSSDDLEDWTVSRVIEQQPGEHLFNTSVCAGPDGYVMAYESNDQTYPAFTVKFARSPNLEDWEEVPGVAFGQDRYTACPCIRYEHGYYYMLYLEHRGPRHWFETYVARSRDLLTWELSSANPVLRATGLDEGINASDPELVEMEGTTWVYFAVGDQLSWMNMKRATFNGDQRQFLEGWFVEPGIHDCGSGPLRP